MSTAKSTIQTSLHRDRQRERERNARHRRAANLDRMRHTRDALERALIVTQTYDDADAVWEDFLDNKTLHVRWFMRQAIRLVQEANELQQEQTLLRRLLAEHQLSLEAIIGVLEAETPPLTWDEHVAHWLELSCKHFQPWTLDQCQPVINAALKDLNAFTWSTDKETSGLNFLGWREQRRVVPERNLFQCQFHKTYKGYDMMDHVNLGWDMYTDAKTFQDVFMGPHVQCGHEVLQQLGPNCVPIRVVQRFPLVETNVHMTLIVCRMKTERGIIQCMRSAHCPELIAVINEPTDLWGIPSGWKQWDRLDGGEHGYKYKIGGTIAGRDTLYLNQWMFEVFGCILRTERAATGMRLVIASDEDQVKES